MRAPKSFPCPSHKSPQLSAVLPSWAVNREWGQLADRPLRGTELHEKATPRPGYVGLDGLHAGLREDLCRRVVANVRTTPCDWAR